jgi:hypothetical protein
MKIISIIRNPRHVPEDTPCEFRVGSPVIEGGHTVSKIMYCRDGFANGPGKEPCYVVKFAEIPEVNQIPASEVVDVGINPDAKPAKPAPKNAEADVELPD